MSEAPEQNRTPKKRRRRKLPTWVPAYLESLAVLGNHTKACEAAQISRGMPYELEKEDEDFAMARQEAMQSASDVLLLEARRRAYEGVDEPVIYQGELSGVWVNDRGEVVKDDAPGARKIPLTVKKYSDTLLIFLIKGQRPEYRDNKEVAITGKGGAPFKAYIVTQGDGGEFNPDEA